MFVEDSRDGFDILASHAVWNYDEANKVIEIILKFKEFPNYPHFPPNS